MSYQVDNLLCNEFIMSKTFPLGFVNNRKVVNYKKFVGRLTSMAGKRDVMMCALHLCDVTAISQQHHTHNCYVYVKPQ